jgi:hypothetical protein
MCGVSTQYLIRYTTEAAPVEVPDQVESCCHVASCCYVVVVLPVTVLFWAGKYLAPLLKLVNVIPAILR